MSAEYDATEFVDNDFQSSHKAAYTGAVNPAPAPAVRAPSREEVDSKVGETQQKLAELKRIQEELERERAGLEETRRRQIEFQTGRQETIQNLTRAVGLLTESEFAHRRDAEQMSKSLVELQAALVKVEATNDQTWTKDNFNVELTRALTAIENARMEWNSARLKFPVLSGEAREESATPTRLQNSTPSILGTQDLGQLCKLGLALTWPLAVVALVVGLLLVFYARH
jgi:DNA repair exonuclease SbcCD ATPase subunit